MRNIFILFLFFTFASGEIIKNEITLEFLKENPRSTTKDFYIWQYLDTDITPNQALEALSEANNVNNNIFFRFAQKFGHDETYAVAQCMQADAKDLILQNDDCIEVGLTYTKALSLSFDEMNIAIAKLQDKYPLKASALEILNSNLPFVRLSSASAEVFFEVFNKTGKNFRYTKLNYRLPNIVLDKIKGNSQFNQTIKLIVTDTRLKNLQNTLIGIDDTNLNFQSSFYLALNTLINSQDKDLSLQYLNNAYKKAYFKIDKDMVMFWQYLVSQDDSILDALSLSWDINIYSLYAMDKLNKKPENVIFDLEIINDIQGPTITQFDWVKILSNLKELDVNTVELYRDIFSKEELPHFTFLKNRFYNYQKSFFITPYEDFLQNESIDKKALIYAIARQESGFIPTAISSSYALGAMQIMPFLANSLSNELGENIYLTDMFNAQTNIKYALKHFEFLEPRLKHPLFISYAYNGGIGYTNREITPLFKEDLPYQPYMAIELISFDETKQYGKKVLANYYIYKKYLSNDEEEFSFNSLLQSLN